MKEIVVISGKGGTGKTSLTASLSYVAANEVVMADCDVDAADLHLILKPENQYSEDFYSGFKAEINPEYCQFCGACFSVCRFEAILRKDDRYEVKYLDCEGCGYCQHVCLAEAINLREQKVGLCHIADARFGCKLVHAELGIGADNSGKLVAKVKRDANRVAKENSKDYILVDGSPGIGCPVISSLSGAAYAVLVTEPSLSGLEDLKRVWELSARFRIACGCVINKADINPEITAMIKDILVEKDIELLSEIPYDEDFPRAITKGLCLMELDQAKWEPYIKQIWEKIR